MHPNDETNKNPLQKQRLHITIFSVSSSYPIFFYVSNVLGIQLSANNFLRTINMRFGPHLLLFWHNWWCNDGVFNCEKAGADKILVVISSNNKLVVISRCPYHSVLVQIISKSQNSESALEQPFIGSSTMDIYCSEWMLYSGILPSNVY